MAYEIVCIGTSILWGQGLHDEEKIPNQVKKLLEGSAKTPRITPPIHICSLAHSGAIIGYKDDETVDTTIKPRLDGEVPTHYPTLLQELDEYDRVASVPAEKVDAVLIEGGVNDVSIMKIFDPLTTSSQLEKRIRRYCYRHTALLLERIAAKFANARLVVLAYYKMLSKESEDEYIAEFLHSKGASVAGRLVDLPLEFISDLATAKILKNEEQFREQSTQAFRDAIDEVNKSLGGKPRIFLAVPPFTARNTAFAPDPWLFAINPDLTPQDDLAAQRSKACDEAGSSRTVMPLCKGASNGHPNAKGAQAYAEAIVAELLRP